MTPELAFRLIEGTLKLDAEYHRLLAEVVEVKDEKLDKIEDLGLGKPILFGILLNSSPSRYSSKYTINPQTTTLAALADPRKNITATHPKIPADLREWLIKQDKAYRLKALVDKSRKFAADNAERVRAEKTRRASETDDASCRDDDEMRGQLSYQMPCALRIACF